MSYIIYKKNGQQLLTLLDGTMDTSRGINLVGKNYVNFGTPQNENFVWLLENFANNTPPAYPMTGQLWYDTSTATLKCFDGTNFSVLANVATLNTNVAAVNSALVSNVANLSSFFSSNISTLTSNAASQDAQITNLWANAAIQASMLNGLSQLVTGSNVDISSLLDSTNARIDSTNACVAVINNTVNIQASKIDNLTASVSTVNDLQSAQAVVQTTQGSQIGALQTGLSATNSAITTANVAMRGYVDATNNTQNTQITNLNTSVSTLGASFTSFYSWANLNFGTSNYSNADVALFLPTYTGNVSARNAYISGGIFWSNGMPFASSNYSNVNTAAYIASGVTTANVVTTNGIFWANGTAYSSGSGSTPSRRALTGTTANIAAGTSANITIAGYKGYALYAIGTSTNAWVSVYANAAARTTDYSRVQSVDPAPGAGVLAEAITTGSTTQYFTPAVFGYNSESSPTTDIQLKVTNTSSTSAAITVTLTVLQMES